MAESKDGMTHAPESAAAEQVVGPGEFNFAAAGLDHGHIYGMCQGLLEAGATLKWVYDPDPVKVDHFRNRFPQAEAADSEARVLEDDAIGLVACAAVPADRADVGLRTLAAGKDFFVDKPPLTTAPQLAAAREAVRKTGRKYAVYYSERLHVESAVRAGQLVADGAIGNVVQVVNLAPHRISLTSRPAWFFEPARYGGILVDIGSHQVEQFLFYAGAADGQVLHSKVGNYRYTDFPAFEDFGDATLLADNGATHYFRVDWLTPDASRAWGDGRLFILGTHGYIECRKYVDVAGQLGPDQLYLVTDTEERRIDCAGKVGFPFFGQLIRDCLARTEEAQGQAHAFKAIELAIAAQEKARRVTE